MSHVMWKIAFRNLLRNRRRSVATGVAIAAGFVGLSLLGAYIMRVQYNLKYLTIYLHHKGHLSIYKNEGLQKFYLHPAKFQITADDKIKIYKVLAEFKSDIEFTGESITGTGLIGNGARSIPFIATGIQPELEDRLQNHPLVKKWSKDFLIEGSLSFSKSAIGDPSAISITPLMAMLLKRDLPFAKLSEDQRSVQLAGRSFTNDLNAVNATLAATHTSGIYFAEDTSLKAPLRLLQDLYQTDGVQYIALYLNEDTNLSQLKSKIEERLRRDGLPYSVFPFDNDIVSPIYVGTMGFLNTMAGFFIFLICGAVALSIINSLTMGILERSKELGAMRALGFLQEDISRLFSREAVILAFMSLLAGDTIAVLISLYVNQLNIRFRPPGLSTDMQFRLIPNMPWVVVVSLLLILTAAVTGYVSAKVKLKSKIVDLLSDSGA